MTRGLHPAAPPLPTKRAYVSSLGVSQALAMAAGLLDEMEATVDGDRTINGYRAFKNLVVVGSIVDEAIATLSPATFLLHRVKVIEKRWAMSRKASQRKAAVKTKKAEARVMPAKKKKKPKKKAVPWRDAEPC